MKTKQRVGRTIDKLDTIIKEAKRFHAGCKNMTIYEYYKARIFLFNLSPEIYEQSIKRLSGILKI